MNENDFKSDYGTYDYKLLLSKWTTTTTSNQNIPPESYWVDTVIATHTQLFPRPEPTFTTSWTKSGLTISADLSSIVGAHPDFYAYLCRDDGTTLATHEFTEGQTTTLLTFAEADYGTYTYQLKLASFSTNELTITAGITSITNAHNSFAITLERDDGTVLQTHTLVNGETSFTFTQTETSYATFNYVVKINGTQTDTYSTIFNPPPTPTFDIALTNDDLAITATLTNIVNPDPYYTLMIHDVNDTHLDGHTFATGDTTVVLTWTETSYGEKTYTKLLNGASIGTETITLTDPNDSTPTVFPSQINIARVNITNLMSTPIMVLSLEMKLEIQSPTVGTAASLTLTSSDVGSTLYLYASHDNSLWMSFVDSTDLIFTYEAPTYRTGTSQSFAFTSGNWKNNGYSAVLDDEANSRSGKLVNGVRQWEWDMPNVGGGRLSSGTAHRIHLVPGTAEDNGTWYRGGSIGTRSGRTISFGDNATFDETNAFVSGLVPYGDKP
ncbi:unnamed protein product [Bathycoccus prasinos]